MKLTNKILKSLINEVLSESQYYYDKSQGGEFTSTKLGLAGAMEPEGSRDRFDQVEKYLQLISKREMQDFASKIILGRGQGYLISRGTRSINPRLQDIMQGPEKEINLIDGSQESLNNWLDIYSAAVQEGIDLLEARYGFDDLNVSDTIPDKVAIGKPIAIYDQLGFKVNNRGKLKSKLKHVVNLANAEEEIKDFHRAGVEHLVAQSSIANLPPKEREMFGAFDK